MEQGIAERIKTNIQNLTDKSLTPPFPRGMLLEVTNICNHSCAFCANSKSDRKKGIIDKELALKILSDAYALGTREVGFYATGEPLIDRNLETYIAYAKDVGFEYVFITTNGALLDSKRANSIVDAGIDSIKFSVNGANRKDYLLIHGKDDYDKVTENLKYVSKLRGRGKDFKLYVSFIMTRHTAGTREEFENNYRKYVDDIIFLKCINQSGYMHEINDFLAIDKDAGGFNLDGICPMIFNKLYITYEGYLTLCCADFQNYLAVADLRRESLEEAWRNKYAQELRRRHLEHNLEGTICGNCVYNRKRVCYPLVERYANVFDMEQYDKSPEIEGRIREWRGEKSD